MDCDADWFGDFLGRTLFDLDVWGADATYEPTISPERAPFAPLFLKSSEEPRVSIFTSEFLECVEKFSSRHAQLEESLSPPEGVRQKYWNMMYGLVREYVAMFGDLPKQKCVFGGRRVGKWLAHNRRVINVSATSDRAMRGRRRASLAFRKKALAVIGVEFIKNENA